MKKIQPPLLVLTGALLLGACSAEVASPELDDEPTAQLGKDKDNNSNNFRFLDEGEREWRWWGFNLDPVNNFYCQATIPGYDGDDWVADYRTYVDGVPQEDGSLHIRHKAKGDALMLAKRSNPTRLGGSLWWPGFEVAPRGPAANKADLIGRASDMSMTAWAVPSGGVFFNFNMTFKAQGELHNPETGERAFVECHFNNGKNQVTITPLN